MFVVSALIRENTLRWYIVPLQFPPALNQDGKTSIPPTTIWGGGPGFAARRVKFVE
jgi:hypothetical protein